MDLSYRTRHFKNSKLNKKTNRNNSWNNLLMRRNLENKNSNKILNLKLRSHMLKKKDKTRKFWPSNVLLS
jgi:hypothetical protein